MMQKLQQEKNSVEGVIDMIYCCAEHVEWALEEIINGTEMAPEFRQIDIGHLSTTTCEYCGKPAAYVVGN